MHTFTKEHRDEKMTNPVSFHRIPMFRGLAFAINHIEEHGAKVDIFSADRRDAIVAEHNRQFGTSLSGQQHLVDLFRAGKGNPANPPSQTSHCLRADATIAALLRESGEGRPRPGDSIPWFALGIDLADHGRQEDVSHFLSVAHHLGYAFRQPYSSGAERHHVVCVHSPIATLERWNVISKNRG